MSVGAPSGCEARFVPTVASAPRSTPHATDTSLCNRNRSAQNMAVLT